MTQATIHTTSCGRYVVSASEAGIDNRVCRSLREAYDLLGAKRIRTAQLAQRVAFDEMVGQPASEDVSYLTLPIPRG